MAPAAVDVHKPNRRLMVRRRSGPAITPAVVYDARLATPGPKRPCQWLEKEVQPVIRARRVHHDRSVRGIRRDVGSVNIAAGCCCGRERTVTRSVAWRPTPGVVQQLLEQGGVLRTDRGVEMEVQGQIYGLVQVLNNAG